MAATKEPKKNKSKANPVKREGGQPGNKNAEKWSEERAVQLGLELVEWILRGEDNIFLDSFFVVERNYYPDLPAYLAGKFRSFSELLKRAKKIQELKIVTGCLCNKFNTGMGAFYLKNHHGYRDKTDIVQETTVRPALDVKKLTTDELRELRRLTIKAKTEDA